MTRRDTTLKSWNRFLIRNLVVAPDILGTQHHFSYKNSTVNVKIPGLDQVDRGKDYDEVASVGTSRAIDNVTLDYHICKVDVEVFESMHFKVPVEVFTRNPKAYDLFTEEEQKHLNEISGQLETIAEEAFEYWTRIIRWVSDDSRIGRDRVEGFVSGWSTYLIDTGTSKKIWLKSQVFKVPAYKVINLEEWREIQQKLEAGAQPPVYIELKHNAEENIRLGEYQRALLDLAMACETFLRFAILQNLPDDLNPKVEKYIELANISQYFDQFFPR